MEYCKTKQIKGAYTNYMWSDDYTLRDVYKSFSYRKERAFDYCKQLCEEYQGHDLKIISYNLNEFTCGFIGYIEGQKAFFYITKSYDRYIYLEDLDA